MAGLSFHIHISRQWRPKASVHYVSTFIFISTGSEGLKPVYNMSELSYSHQQAVKAKSQCTICLHFHIHISRQGRPRASVQYIWTFIFTPADSEGPKPVINMSELSYSHQQTVKAQSQWSICLNFHIHTSMQWRPRASAWYNWTFIFSWAGSEGLEPVHNMSDLSY